jgi:tripartite-type tricarboxylate transporter receptor subunit TctC
MVASITSTRPDWFPQKKVTVPFQIALERSPAFPDSPALGEFVKDTRTRQVLELVVSHMAMDKPVLLPPGVPAERVALLRRAFQAAVTDPGFIAQAEREHVQMAPATAEHVHHVLDAAYAMPADVVKAANDALNITGAGADN